jgi:hypothetical protein
MGRRSRILLHLHIQLEGGVLRGSLADGVLVAETIHDDDVLRVCVREGDVGGREVGAHSTTPTYTVRRWGPAREPSWLAFWLQKPSILRACVREEDAGGGEVARILLHQHIHYP